MHFDALSIPLNDRKMTAWVQPLFNLNKRSVIVYLLVRRQQQKSGCIERCIFLIASYIYIRQLIVISVKQEKQPFYGQNATILLIQLIYFHNFTIS